MGHAGRSVVMLEGRRERENTTGTEASVAVLLLNLLPTTNHKPSLICSPHPTAVVARFVTYLYILMFLIPVVFSINLTMT